MLSKIIKLNNITEKNGRVTILEGETDQIPFKISRIFNVYANSNDIRGRHAHKKCTQLLLCTCGEVEVTCYDKQEKKTYILDNPNKGLLIPPMVWAEQIYKLDKSILTVLCDRIYEEEDYIRNYNKYLTVNY